MKKLFTLTLSLIIAISAVLPALPSNVSAAVNKFTDVSKTSAYYADVNTLVERGVISGYADNSFKPNADLTRGQAAKILAIALELKIEPITKSQFTDVALKNQYLPYIEALVKKEIISGFSKDLFKPENTLTRAQMAKILVRGYNLPASLVELPFADVSTKSVFHSDIQSLYQAGITKGNTETTYSPNSSVKRGQMASFVMRSERATVTNGGEKQLQESIVKIDGQQIILTSGSYKIAGNLQPLLSEKNNNALKNALITATVKGDNLLSVSSLTITAQGTSTEPVNLNGALEKGPTASVAMASVEADIVSSFSGVLRIESNYILINNLKVVKELVVSSKVREMTINHHVSLLSVLEGAQATIKGVADVDKVTVASDKSIYLQLAGAIKELNISSLKAAIQLGLTSKVNAVKTAAGVKVDTVISNYNEVKTNILKVNDEVSLPGGSTPGGGTSSESTTPSVSETITGIIKTTSAPAILIDGKSYVISDQKVATFLHSRNTALDGSKITVLITNGQIVDIKSLVINSEGEIDGGLATVSGFVEVNADNVTLKNMTINGDLVLLPTVTTAFTTSKLIVNGTTKVEEVKTVARIANTNAAQFLAENATTSVTITFSDSTIATFIINKKDILMNADGSSSIRAISVEASGTVLNSGNILPQISIKGNSTAIELNATIKEIKIDSNEPITITGNANIKNLEVNSTQEVALNVNGVIEKVDVKSDGKISLGTDLNVGSVAVPGNKNIDTVIKDYSTVSDKINIKNTVNTDEKNLPFAAGLQAVENRFGYHTIQTEFTKGKQVRYLLIESTNKPEDKPKFIVGNKAPVEAVIDTGDAISFKMDKNYKIQNIAIFLTETDGTILEYSFIETNNNVAIYFPRIDFTVNGDKLIVKTIFNDSFTPKEELAYVRMYSEKGLIAEQVLSPTDSWVKNDGLNSVEVSIKNQVNVTDKYYLSTKRNSMWNLSKDNDEFLSVIVNSATPFIYDYPEFKDEIIFDIYRYLVESGLNGGGYSIGMKEANLLYDFEIGTKTLAELKAIANTIYDYKLTLGDGQLGFVPAYIVPFEGQWNKNPRHTIKNKQVEILAGPIGAYSYEVRDAANNPYKLEVTFSKDGANGFKATHKLSQIIKEQTLPFILTSTTTGPRIDIDLTFTNDIDPTNLELTLNGSPLYVTTNERNNVFSIFSEDGNFKDKTLTVKYFENLFTFSIDANNKVKWVMGGNG